MVSRHKRGALPRLGKSMAGSRKRPKGANILPVNKKIGMLAFYGANNDNATATMRMHNITALKPLVQQDKSLKNES